jgi:TPR repeat protein
MRPLLILLLSCTALMAYLPPASSRTAFLGAQDQDQLTLQKVPLPAPDAPPSEELSLLARTQAQAEHGDLDAQARLGVMYYWGQDAPKDWDKAQIWLRRAAERNNRDAEAKLGAMCFLGQGCAANEAEAIKWFQRAADQGEPYSAGCIGVMYAVGEGVPRDLLTSFIWLYQAEALGDKDAAEPLRQVKQKLTPDQIEEGVRRAEAAIHSRDPH